MQLTPTSKTIREVTINIFSLSKFNTILKRYVSYLSTSECNLWTKINTNFTVRNNTGLIPSSKGMHRYSRLVLVFILWIVPVSEREISLIFNGKFPPLDGIYKRACFFLLFTLVSFSFFCRKIPEHSGINTVS